MVEVSIVHIYYFLSRLGDYGPQHVYHGLVALEDLTRMSFDIGSTGNSTLPPSGHAKYTSTDAYIGHPILCG